MLTMRVTTAVHDRIKAAAEANGRSVTQEIESRLERSFLEDERYGGTETHAFVALVGATIAMIEARSKASWFEDVETWKAVQTALARLVTEMAPKSAARPEAADTPSPEVDSHTSDPRWALLEKIHHSVLAAHSADSRGGRVFTFEGGFPREHELPMGIDAEKIQRLEEPLRSQVVYLILELQNRIALDFRRKWDDRTAGNGTTG